LILTELRNLLLSFMYICQLRCQTCPYQTCPFQHFDRLPSGAGFRSSMHPSWSLLTVILFLWLKGFTPGTKVASFSN
jgi:hypothetical protein